MILVDTSVWIAHLRHGDPKLADCLAQDLVLIHPWVVGELACGNLGNREMILSDLHALPSAQRGTDAEAFAMIEAHKLRGRGLGWIDVHLLLSSMLSSCRLWTLDNKLRQVALKMGLGARE